MSLMLIFKVGCGQWLADVGSDGLSPLIYHTHLGLNVW